MSTSTRSARGTQLVLCNAFSLQMLSWRKSTEYDVNIIKITIAQARHLIDSNGLASAVGHADTATLLSDLLGVAVAANRVSVELTPGSRILVAQVEGGRLPEGCTTLPEGVRIGWYLVGCS